MIRNLKALGLALVAVFALSAMAASSASADTLEAAKPPTAFLTGTQGAVLDEFIVTDGLTFCKKVTYKGVATVPAKEVTKVEPTYSECKSLGQPAEVDMNSCFYNLTIDDTAAGETTGNIHIKCAKTGDEITVTVAPPTTKCIIHVEEQTIPVTYSAAGGKVTVTIADYNKLKYSETKGASGMGTCAASSPVTQTNGTYKGEAIVSGFEDAAHTKANALSLVK